MKAREADRNVEKAEMIAKIGSWRGVLVTARHALSQEPGGQQICTREFIETIEAAGVSIENLAFDLANGWREKIGRRLDRRPYRWILPQDLAGRVVDVAQRTNADFIFLNTTDVSPLAAEDLFQTVFAVHYIQDS